MPSFSLTASGSVVVFSTMSVPMELFCCSKAVDVFSPLSFNSVHMDTLELHSEDLGVALYSLRGTVL